MIVADLPRRVRSIGHALIPLEDGANLAARIWLPEDADRDKVSAILEYLPTAKVTGLTNAMR